MSVIEIDLRRFSLRSLSIAIAVVAALLGTFVLLNQWRQPAPFRKMPALQALSQAQVVAKFGEPDRSETFSMLSATDEFRVGLLNKYPLNNPLNAFVQITEMTWRDGEYWITVWFHQPAGQWIVLDSCCWHKDLVF